MARQALQLVRDAERQHLWAVENTAHRAPRSFDDREHGRYVPRWGSLALLKLAIQAKTVRLEPVGVTLRDVSGLPLEPEIAERANDVIVESLSLGDLDAAQAGLEGPGGPFVVLSVELLSEDGDRVQVERFGGFEVTEQSSVPALIDAAKTILSIS